MTSDRADHRAHDHASSTSVDGPPSPVTGGDTQALVARTPRTPAAMAQLLAREPARTREILMCLHGVLGNAFVQQVLAVCRPGANGVAPNAGEVMAKSAASSGAPLPAALKGKFEQSLGADLGDVRVHTGEGSSAAAQAVGARAYAVGQDIHFAEGQYDPSSRAGEELLAHEVAHTVQQGHGAPGVESMQTKLAVSTPGDGMEAEADHAASAMIDGHAARVSPDAGAARGVVQRKVGYEFEAQWNVRDCDNLTNGENVAHQHAITEREAMIDVRVMALMAEARQPLTPEEQLLSANDRWTAWIDLNGVADRNLLLQADPAPLRMAQLTDAGRLRLAAVPGGIRDGVAQNLMVANVVGEKPLEGRNIPKAGKLIQGTNYALTADASPSGGSNLEWVTDPLESADEVNAAMDGIVGMATYLDGRKTEAHIPLDDVANATGTAVQMPNVRIYPFGGSLSFAPQVTGGFRLDKIGELIDKLRPRSKGTFERESTWQKNEDFKNSLYTDVASMAASLSGARKACSETWVREIAGPDGTKELEGLVMILANYLSNAAALEDGANAKSIAGGMMARTDFAHNFRLLPRSLRTHFSKTPDDFVRLVLTAAGMEGTEDTQVFEHTVERGLAGQRQTTQITLTRGSWLGQIPRGFDLMKNFSNQSELVQEALSESGKQTESEAIHKSLGALGSVDDQVGPKGNRTEALVVELRRMQDRRTAAELKPLATSVWDMIDKLNKS